MELRDVLRICSGILGLCFYGVAIIGNEKLKKVVKQDELETLREKILKTTSRNIVCSILGTIFSLFSIFLLH